MSLTTEPLGHRKQMERVDAAARVASAAAKPRLLRLLAEPGFIEGLRGCCPELEAMTPSQRLDWFDAESAAAEMVRTLLPALRTRVGSSHAMHCELLELNLSG